MIPRGLLPRRKRNTHKGQAGRVFILAGSEGMSGAAALAVKGALRTGAGLVTLGIPKRLHDPMVKKLTEAMLKVFAETAQGSLSRQAAAAILRAIQGMDVVALGPGLSRNPQTQALIRLLIGKIDKPLVIDADGLNALSGSLSLLRKRKQPSVLTPHSGEMARLIDKTAKAVEGSRQTVAKAFAIKHRVVLVLKGHRSIVAGADGQLYVNHTGNPGMATGGCGDVLTGMIAALLAQGLNAYDAACLGVYLHGFAGDIAAKKRGEIGLIASDLADTIPLAIRRYQTLPV